MKKTISFFVKIFLALVFITNSVAFSQSIKVWNKNLYPEDFKAFNTGGYTSISGNLTITKNDSINLTLLNKLVSVKGTLRIEDRDKLIDLKGLDNLEKLGALMLRRNKALKSIENLKKIKHLDYIEIVNNNSLINLKGLENVSGNVNKGIFIEENSYLKEITSLSKIEKAKHIVINYSPRLRSISFPNLVTLDDGIKIFSTSVSELKFEKLKKINSGNLTIINSSLESLNGFPVLDYVDAKLEIISNPRLTSVSLNGLNEVQYLRISDNYNLKQISGFKNLKKTEYLHIDRNTNLIEIPNLKLKHVDSVLITNNDALESISFLRKIETINKSLNITKNYSLTNLSGLENVSVVGNLYINHNNSIKSLSKLKHLNSIKNECIIDYNPSLTYYDLPLKFIKKDMEQSRNNNNILEAPNVLLKNLICKHKLNPEAFTGLTRQELRIIRNLPYAKKGLKFKSNFLNTYFSNHFWFDTDDNLSSSNMILDEIEDFNIKLLKKREDSLNKQVVSKLIHLRNIETIKIPNNYSDLQLNINAFLAKLPSKSLNTIPVTLTNKMYNFDFSAKTQIDTNPGYYPEAIIGITFTEVDKFHIAVVNYSKENLDVNEFIFHYKLDENEEYILLD